MFKFWLTSPLYEAAGDGTGGGGGGTGDGTGGTGTGTGTGTGEGDKPPAWLEGFSTTLKDGFTTQINGLGARFEKRLKDLETKAAGTGTGTGTGSGQGGGQGQGQGTGTGTGSTALDLANQQLREQKDQIDLINNERKAEREQSQRVALESEIRNSLSDFTWDPTQGGRDVALDYFKGKATRTEDGQVVIGDVPIAKFIKEQVPRMFKGMLATRQVGGSGAEHGSRNNGGKAAVDLKDIKVGMTADEEKRVRAALADQLKELHEQYS